MIKNNELIIGAARFSGIYGIKNNKSILSTKKIKKIIKLSKKNKILSIDTAISYKNANNILGKIGINDFIVNSKLPLLDFKNKKLEQNIENMIIKHINILKIKKLNILYLHDPNQILKDKKNKIINSLINLKKKKYYNKIGFSIYTPAQLPKLLKKFKPDAVQIPLNIFDRTFLKSGEINNLKKNNIEIHVRSIFLQGLLLYDKNNIPKQFNKWNFLFDNFQKWIENKKISKIQACLSILKIIKHKIKLIVGVEDENQLNEICVNLKKIKTKPPKNIFSNDFNLINPSRWKKIKTSRFEKIKPMKLALFIQARLTSRRFPGKMMKTIKNKTIIELVLERISKVENVNKVMVLIPKNLRNYPLYKKLKSLNCDVYRGSEFNVLERFYKAAKKIKAENIIRITGDCPLLDVKILNTMIKKFLSNKYEYITNSIPRTYPNGMDVEIFTFKALQNAWKKAKSPYDKEHVTPLIIKNRNKFNSYNKRNKSNLSNFRLTLDTPKDYILIKKIYQYFWPDLGFNLDDIMKVEKKFPHWFKINA